MHRICTNSLRGSGASRVLTHTHGFARDQTLLFFFVLFLFSVHVESPVPPSTLQLKPRGGDGWCLRLRESGTFITKTAEALTPCRRTDPLTNTHGVYDLFWTAKPIRVIPTDCDCVSGVFY